MMSGPFIVVTVIILLAYNHIIESVDSDSSDVHIYVIHYNKPTNSEQAGF